MATAKTRPTATVDAETARKIWLAGVGAYGRAFDNAREQIGKINEDAATYFDELVARGEKIESATYSRIKSNKRLSKVAKRAGSLSERAERAAEQQREFVETRMASLRETLEMPMGVLGMGREIRTLSTQLKELAQDVATIKATLKPTAKKAAKKAAKASPKRAAKTTSRTSGKRTTKKATKKAAK